MGASSMACRGKPLISAQRERNHRCHTLQFLFSQFSGSRTRAQSVQGLTAPSTNPLIFHSSLFLAVLAKVLSGEKYFCAAA
jgi:hypothetical protein